MNRLPGFIWGLFLLTGFSVSGQKDFYDPSVIHEIRIRFSEPGWRSILDSLFIHTGDQGKLTGDVSIDGHWYMNAGIRYKGYSSYNADAIKNPFNIDLDYSVKNRNHEGFTKLKLGNVIHDPTFVREVLSYEIARDYMPASRAGYANLYINDTLIGLYTNVEAVDEPFIARLRNDASLSFFKGEPARLEYPFGENANLALSHGSDPAAYMPYYRLLSEDEAGWNELYELIARLDQGADSVADLLNIDRTLWMHAFNETLLNLDSYIGYAQNYYLYMDDNGRFNPVLWDMNMSFGSFRDSDGSIHFKGLTIPQIQQLEPLALMYFAVSPRPLMTKLFANDTLRKIYYAHMRTIVDEKFRYGWYYDRARALQAVISDAVQQDPNRFYSYDDFLLNLEVTTGGTGSMKEYPGIRELMEARLVYLEGLPGFNGAPEITEIRHEPEVPAMGEECVVTARMNGASMAMLGYRCKSGGIFQQIPMTDDGLHHDGAAGDGVFGATFSVSGQTIQFYLYAENDSAAILSPERAEFEFHTIRPMAGRGDLLLNEFHTGNSDETWIELFNPASEPIHLGGMRLIIDPVSSVAWTLPDTVIEPKRYFVADARIFPAAASPFFTLSVSGGTLILVNRAGIVVDSIGYGRQITDKSMGRFPNGAGPFGYMPLTRGGYNAAATTPSKGFRLFPDPAENLVNLEISQQGKNPEIIIFSIDGREVYEMNDTFTPAFAGPVIRTLDVSHLRSGLYIVRVNNNGAITSGKLIIR